MCHINSSKRIGALRRRRTDESVEASGDATRRKHVGNKKESAVGHENIPYWLRASFTEQCTLAIEKLHSERFPVVAFWAQTIPISKKARDLKDVYYHTYCHTWGLPSTFASKTWSGLRSINCRQDAVCAKDTRMQFDFTFGAI